MGSQETHILFDEKILTPNIIHLTSSLKQAARFHCQMTRPATQLSVHASVWFVWLALSAMLCYAWQTAFGLSQQYWPDEAKEWDLRCQPHKPFGIFYHPHHPQTMRTVGKAFTRHAGVNLGQREILSASMNAFIIQSSYYQVLLTRQPCLYCLYFNFSQKWNGKKWFLHHMQTFFSQQRTLNVGKLSAPTCNDVFVVQSELWIL